MERGKIFLCNIQHRKKVRNRNDKPKQDPEKHRELLEIAAAGTAIGREDTDYEDGAMKGLKHTITAIMPDGSRATEERIYSTLEPKLKKDKIAEYLETE